MFAFFPKFGARTRLQDLWPFLISETGLKFLIWTQGKIHPGNRASPVNRAHMKRPLVAVWRYPVQLTQFYCVSRTSSKFGKRKLLMKNWPEDLGLTNEILFRNDVDGFLTLKQFSFGQFCETQSSKWNVRQFLRRLMTFSFYLPEAISTRFLIYMQRIFLDQLDGLLLEGTWVNFSWVCGAGNSEPLAHYSLFCVQF